MSFFDDVPFLPTDAILGLPVLFAADPRKEKVNLGIGAYKTAEGDSLVLTSVKTAEREIFQKNLNKDYLPIEGETTFLNLSLQLLFSTDLPKLNRQNLFTSQTIGGSGALRISAEFLARNISKTMFVSNPTWPNHHQIFERAGLDIKTYPYISKTQNQFDFDGMMQAIQNMPPRSILLLHGCCHNPTGLDPSMDQWKALSASIKSRQLIPLFDMAYHGFGQNLEKDSQPVRLFALEGHEMLVCYSFSKNFGLYGERIGFLTVVSSSTEASERVGSQIKAIIRGNYSTPCLHGSRIVKNILSSPDLILDWQQELQNMCERIQEMRETLVATLLVKEAPRDFSFILHQKGIFSLLGLNSEQVQQLRTEKGIYMPSNGRINIAGLNTENIEYVAEAIAAIS